MVILLQLLLQARHCADDDGGGGRESWNAWPVKATSARDLTEAEMEKRNHRWGCSRAPSPDVKILHMCQLVSSKNIFPMQASNYLARKLTTNDQPPQFGGFDAPGWHRTHDLDWLRKS
jgi:hypothetical protein